MSLFTTLTKLFFLHVGYTYILAYVSSEAVLLNYVFFIEIILKDNAKHPNETFFLDYDIKIIALPCSL